MSVTRIEYEKVRGLKCHKNTECLYTMNYSYCRPLCMYSRPNEWSKSGYLARCWSPLHSQTTDLHEEERAAPPAPGIDWGPSSASVATTRWLVGRHTVGIIMCIAREGYVGRVWETSSKRKVNDTSPLAASLTVFSISSNCFPNLCWQ